MATSLTLRNDPTLQQGYVQVNGTTSATFTTTGITGNLTGNVTGSLTAGGSLTLATAQTASGTSVDFTGIPSWVKRITVMFSGVSTNGGSAIQIQIGAGSVTTTGYSSTSGFYTNLNQTAVSTATSGFVEAVSGAITTAATRTGTIVVQNLSSNTWIASGVYGNSGNTVMTSITGSISLGGTLDRLRITTANGTDTFDAGTINIMFEG